MSSVAISGHQWSSVVISGNQVSSVAIKSHQWPSSVISGTCRCAHQWSSVAIKCHQWPSSVIKGHQVSSSVIKGHQVSSVEPVHLMRSERAPSLMREAIKSNQRPSSVISAPDEAGACALPYTLATRPGDETWTRADGMVAVPPRGPPRGWAQCSPVEGMAPW